MLRLDSIKKNWLIYEKTCYQDVTLKYWADSVSISVDQK